MSDEGTRRLESRRAVAVWVLRLTGLIGLAGLTGGVLMILPSLPVAASGERLGGLLRGWLWIGAALAPIAAMAWRSLGTASRLQAEGVASTRGLALLAVLNLVVAVPLAGLLVLASLRGWTLVSFAWTGTTLGLLHGYAWLWGAAQIAVLVSLLLLAQAARAAPAADAAAEP